MLSVKSIKILVKINIFLSISLVYTLFRQTFDLTHGTSVRNMVSLILVKKGFQLFHRFYSIRLDININIDRYSKKIQVFL